MARLLSLFVQRVRRIVFLLLALFFGGRLWIVKSAPLAGLLVVSAARMPRLDLLHRRGRRQWEQRSVNSEIIHNMPVVERSLIGTSREKD